MKKRSYKIEDLSPNMFWDTNVKEIDWEAHQSFILERTMQYGNLNDWSILKKVYGLRGIKNIALNLRNLDDFSLAFLSLVLKVDKEKFRCYTFKQSHPSFWTY